MLVARLKIHTTIEGTENHESTKQPKMNLQQRLSSHKKFKVIDG